MIAARSKWTLCMTALTLGATLALAGCGGDGVELNGKLFDWMGVSESANSATKREPKLADRSPLIVPPNMQRLPEPGSEGAPPDVSLALNDPERLKAQAAADREKLHQQYCSGEKNWKERALDRNAPAARSPYGPCNQFIGDSLQPNTAAKTVKQ